MIGGAPQADRDKQRKAEIREQRRYEIAREAMVALWTHSQIWDLSVAAKDATQVADALLAELGE